MVAKVEQQAEQQPIAQPKPATVEQVVKVLPKEGSRKKAQAPKPRKRSVKKTKHDRIIAQVAKKASKPARKLKAKKKV